MSDAQLIAHHIAQVAATAHCYPGVVIIHNTRTHVVEYMSDRGLALLQTTPEELREMGPAYNLRFFNPEDSADYAPKIFALFEQNDLEAVTTFFQQVRTTQSAHWTLYFTSLKLLARGPDGLPLLLFCFSCPVQPDNHLTRKVERLLDENAFLRRHAATFACLSAREREVLRGLALGKSAAELAATLFISPQTVETHRRNLRRKLEATSTFDLGQYARAFDLI